MNVNILSSEEIFSTLSTLTFYGKKKLVFFILYNGKKRTLKLKQI